MILIVCFVKKNHPCTAGEICKGVLFLLRGTLQGVLPKMQAESNPENQDFITHGKEEK
jgi:hypothetical protein